MKKLCLIMIAIILLMTISSETTFASDETIRASKATPAMLISTAAPTLTDTSELGADSVTLSIDNTNKYEGMDKAYQDGYVPIVKDDKAIIVLPLIASGELKENSLTAVPRLGDPGSSPFVFKNYQITVEQKDNSVNDSASVISSYIVYFEFSLTSDRLNGVYSVSIDIAAAAADGSEIAQTFTTYVTIADGQLPGNDNPQEVPDTGTGNSGADKVKSTSQPKVIVSNYEINPTPVIAGEEFTIKVMLRNTSEKKAVQNMTVDISCESPNLTLQNDSSTVFIDKLAKAATTEIELKYKTDLEIPTQKYNITFAISYDDSDAVPLESSGMVEVTVLQALNIKMELPQIAAQVNAGDTMPLSIQVMNLGRSQIYNVRVELSAPGLIPSGTAFIGNMEAGTALEGKMDVFIGTKDMSEAYEGGDKYGLTSGTLTLIYEDANGQEYSDIIDISTTINKPVVNSANTAPEEKPQTVSQWWISIVIGAVVLSASAAYPIIRRKRKV